MRTVLSLALGAALVLLAGCQTTLGACDPVCACDATPQGDGCNVRLSRRDPFLGDCCGPLFGECCPQLDLACWPCTPGRTTYVDATASFLPNIGIGLGAGKIVARSEHLTHALEVGGIFQFIDDESFIDDNNPAAGNWTQLRAGLKTTLWPKARRHLTFRVGGVYIHAAGVPNILEIPGDYFGIYGSVGFETDVTSCLTIGPEIAVMAVTPDDRFHIEGIPQVNYHVIWWPGRGHPDVPRAPLGEIYAGLHLSALPGLGAGLTFGHVLARTDAATYSFEMLATFQDASDALLFTGNGEYGQVRGGFKALFQPCCQGHLTARAGATWLRSTTTSDVLSGPGDYFGLYAGLGYELDLSPRLSTGPELTLFAVDEEKGSFKIDVIPQINWHLTLKL